MAQDSIHIKVHVSPQAILYCFSNNFQNTQLHINIIAIKIKNLPKDIFSPASGGRQKVRRASDEIKAHGMIKLNPQQSVLRRICIENVMSIQGSGQHSYVSTLLLAGQSVEIYIDICFFCNICIVLFTHIFFYFKLVKFSSCKNIFRGQMADFRKKLDCFNICGIS